MRKQFEHLEDAPLTYRARVQHVEDGEYITTDSVVSIAYTVTDTRSGTVVETQAVSVEDTVFDELQLPSTWTADAVGFNFAHTLPATCFPEPNRRYAVTYVFTTAGEPLVVAFDVMTTESFVDLPNAE